MFFMLTQWLRLKQYNYSLVLQLLQSLRVMRNGLLFIILLVSLTCSGQKIVLVIDPGHGGKDPGHLALEKGMKDEKHLNLIIAQKLGKYISENLANVEVHFTRNTDVFTSLDARVDFANNLKADYLLSIHCNGSDNIMTFGTESHVHNRKTKKSLDLANLIESQFKNRAARKSRGVKTGRDRRHSVQVLKYSNMPSVLVECGFITNKKEANFLNSVYGQEIIASAVFRAFRAYLKINYPSTNFEKPAKASISNSNVYRVQIMSSIDLIEKSPAFVNLGVPVEAVKVSSSSMYKYKYYAGSFSSKEAAKKVLEKAQKNGFPDAFITLVE